MACKIIIPSHRRHDKILAKKLLVNPILCVEESQKAIYKEYNPDLEIVTHPDSIKGLMAKNQWMLEHFEEMFMVDDDVYSFIRLHYECGEIKTIKDANFITQKILELHGMAKLTNINLFGFNKDMRPEYYDEFRPIVLNKMVGGKAYGIIADGKLNYNNDMILGLKEDYWISGLQKYYNRMILIDTRYAFVQKDNFINPGGLSAIRNEKTELLSSLKIKECFGSCVELKKSTNSAKMQINHNISFRFPF